MRIILILNKVMDTSPNYRKELILNKKEIDFAPATVARLRRTVLRKIETVAHAVCEPVESFRKAVLCNAVTIGGAQTSMGQKYIYLKVQDQNFVLPYIDTH